MKKQSGKVISNEGDLYGVYLIDHTRVFAKPRGKFRHEKIRVSVGDDVVLYADERNELCIDEILQRKNHLLRPRISNVDRLFIVAAAESPAPVYLNIDKLTSVCEQNGITPVIVVGKTDLSPKKAEELERVYQKTGYRVFPVSCATSEGVDRLRAFVCSCRGETIGFAGASGVGKSTLLNALFPCLRLETGMISRKIGRGKHTTRKVDLFPIEELCEGASGFIADTPGFSLLDFENFDFYSLDDLPENFPEFRRYLGKCRYTKCTHRKEEGCMILEKMREGEIAGERVQSYTELYALLKDKKYS